MKIELASALAARDNGLMSFDARSAYLLVNGFYVNVLTVVRGTTLKLEQSMAMQETFREKWQRFATRNFLVEFRCLENDGEGRRRLKLILAEVEDWEATDRLYTEDIDEVDFEARDAVKAIFEKHDLVVLDSGFQWPGVEDKVRLAATHLPFKPGAGHPQLQTIADLQAFDNGITADVLGSALTALGIKGMDKSLALGAYIGLPIKD